MGEDSRWRNRAAARWVLSAPFTISHHADDLHCPWLVCGGEGDLGELRTHPGVDHLDVYDGPEHEALVADQLAFLRRHLHLA